MDLVLFCVFVAISFVLVGLGFYRSEHAELPLVGFFFLFLLSLLLIGGNVDYLSGTQTIVSYNYTNSTLTSSTETVINSYSPIQISGDYSHWFGFYLAIASAVGMIGTFLGIRRGKHEG